MQIYLMTRGKDSEIAQWAKWMATRHMPLKMTKPDGTVIEPLMECLLRPIQLWEFVCPKEYLDIVTNSFGLYRTGNPFMSGYNINPKMFALRKLLGAKEIPEPKPEFDKDGKKLPPSKFLLPYEEFKNINVLGIGYRDEGEISELTHERI